MRKLVVVAVVGLLLSLVAAGPALAQRDPFKEGGGQSSQEPSRDRGQNGAVDPPADPEVAQTSPEVLPFTGTESLPWLGVAYVLVAMGAGALVLVRLYRPSRI